MKTVAVIGSGSWGTALASVLAENKLTVRMWSHRKDVANEIKFLHTNKRYLPHARLSKNITCSTSLADTLNGATLVLFVVPSHAMREVARNASPLISSDAIVLHASKGLEIETSKRLSEVLEEELPNSFQGKVGVLSGPSHAEEVVQKNPTTVSVSSRNKEIAKKIQALFSNDYFRVYINHDIIGVELGGTLKNIIAIGAGISDGLGYGDNAKAALLTRGIVEMTRFSVAHGANQSTLQGLAGIGDLIVTGTSKHSRNWKTGNLLAKGYTLEDALAELGMVAEGVKTTKATYMISKRLDIDMPIVCEIYHILFKNKDPRQATKDLMNREFKNENDPDD